MIYKIGIGYDIHKLAKGRDLVLGGVKIPHDKGLEGHSDADVLLHAVCDALLGAAGQGDIGEHFPNTDEKYRGISSLELLKTVDKMVKTEGFEIGNIDAVIQAEEPKLAGHKPQMKAAIGEALGLPADRINIKATTQERLGAIGRKEGIAAFASALLMKKA